MTDNYAKKKHVRNYADKRGLKYTEAKAIIQPDNGERIRAGIDDIISEIVEHDKIDMAKRADNLGYMNGSLDANVLRSYLPLLDKLDDGWMLRNIGVGYNYFVVSHDDEETAFVIVAGHYVNGEPTEHGDILTIADPLDIIDGMTICVNNHDEMVREDRFVDFATSVLDIELGHLGQTIFVDGNDWQLNLSRDGKELDEWTTALADAMNGALAAYQQITKKN